MSAARASAVSALLTIQSAYRKNSGYRGLTWSNLSRSAEKPLQYGQSRNPPPWLQDIVWETRTNRRMQTEFAYNCRFRKRIAHPHQRTNRWRDVEGGERRVDVIEFLTITAAIGADPVKMLRALKTRSA
jgi:hypothetical protein